MLGDVQRLKEVSDRAQLRLLEAHQIAHANLGASNCLGCTGGWASGDLASRLRTLRSGVLCDTGSGGRLAGLDRCAAAGTRGTGVILLVADDRVKRLEKLGRHSDDW